MRSSSGPERRRRWRARSAWRALAARAAEPARARVGGGDEHEARREDHHLLAADDRHVAVLERLAQRLEARAGELRQLVEEQHAAVGERRLAGLRRVGAADEPGRGDRVVRRAERARGDEPGRAAQAGDGLDPRDLDRLLGRERRQDRRQPPRDHRLAGARRALEEQVVPARGGDLEPGISPLWPRTSASSASGSPRSARLVGQRRRLGVPAQRGDELLQRLDPEDLDVRHQRGLRARERGITSRRSSARRAPSATASAPRTGRTSPGQRQLADDRAALDRLRLQLVATRRAARRPAAGRTPARPCAGRPARG